jgi:hypothetical protein
MRRALKISLYLTAHVLVDSGTDETKGMLFRVAHERSGVCREKQQLKTAVLINPRRSAFEIWVSLDDSPHPQNGNLLIRTSREIFNKDQ